MHYFVWCYLWTLIESVIFAMPQKEVSSGTEKVKTMQHPLIRGFLRVVDSQSILNCVTTRSDWLHKITIKRNSMGVCNRQVVGTNEPHEQSDLNLVPVICIYYSTIKLDV